MRTTTRSQESFTPPFDTILERFDMNELQRVLSNREYELSSNLLFHRFTSLCDSERTLPSPKTMGVLVSKGIRDCYLIEGFRIFADALERHDLFQQGTFCGPGIPFPCLRLGCTESLLFHLACISSCQTLTIPFPPPDNWLTSRFCQPQIAIKSTVQAFFITVAGFHRKYLAYLTYDVTR